MRRTRCAFDQKTSDLNGKFLSFSIKCHHVNVSPIMVGIAGVTAMKAEPA